MKKALFITRAQPLHYGHLDMISDAQRDGYEIVIGLGSSNQKPSPSNPFTLDERIRMIKSCLPKTEIIPLPDLGNYPKWIESIEHLIPDDVVVYTNSALTKKLFRDKGYRVVSTAYRRDTSATHVRECIYANDRWEELVPEQVAKIIKEIGGEKRIKQLIDAPIYQKPSLTVDAIMKYGDKMIFIERGKDPYKGKLAFAGGYVDPYENPEKAIMREVNEETGLNLEIKGMMRKVYCESGRDPRGWVTSLIYFGEATGEFKAGDDAAKVVLLSLEEALQKDLAFDHLKILADYNKLQGEKNVR
ncbi:MAG: nicotinamide-nucleotide adenylyltransferase [Candidatus Aenigmarchaeota archaeon]|nr:nicotinamide-nucleotide adenylyltransferase [Candidatus Aenigmarchaeota archaeon]